MALGPRAPSLGVRERAGQPSSDRSCGGALHARAECSACVVNMNNGQNAKTSIRQNFNTPKLQYTKTPLHQDSHVVIIGWHGGPHPVASEYLYVSASGQSFGTCMAVSVSVFRFG